MARAETKQSLQARVAELEEEVEQLQAKLDSIADVIGEYDEMYESENDDDDEDGDDEEG